jgi:diacylglycerol kinase (ATP)
MVSYIDDELATAAPKAAGIAGRRILVIFNPAAGRSPRRRLRAVLGRLAALGCAVTLRETAARGDAEGLARAADPERFDAVVAAGGDGTINEVANGLDARLPLGILPLGTGNVLAHEARLPSGGREVAALLAHGAARPIWTGEIVGADGTQRRFLMMAGLGFDAGVVARLDERLKQRVGKLAFALAIVAELVRYRPARFAVTCEGVRREAASAVVVKGHFYGGRFVLAPAARLDQPYLWLVLFKRPGRLAAIRTLVALGLGRVHRLADVEIVRTCRVDLELPVGAKIEGDGDIVATLPVTIRVAAEPLRLIQPG